MRKSVSVDDDDEAAQLKRYGQALTHVMAPQPDEVTDTPGWFKGVENQFYKLGVTPKFRLRLIYKYLSTRSRALYLRLSSDIRDDYDKMKEAILKDLRLSAKTFLERFNRVKKRPSDTFTLYESRLAAPLKQYLSSRKVETFDSLVNLLVSDRMKSDLNEACLRHIVGLESVIGDDGWIEPKRLAGIINDYVANVSPALHPTELVFTR